MIYKAIVIGCSAGGLKALTGLLSEIEADFPVPLVICQHVKTGSGSCLAGYLDERCALSVKEAELREPIEAGNVYVAPAGYHLLIEEECTFSLNVDPRVSYAIPSIDVLFESAAVVYEEQLIGVLLTGANSDGSDGVKCIKESGGLVIVQDPDTAEVPIMPQAAIDAVAVDHISDISGIAAFLKQICSEL